MDVNLKRCFTAAILFSSEYPGSAVLFVSAYAIDSLFIVFLKVLHSGSSLHLIPFR